MTPRGQEEQRTSALVCLECHDESEQARGWRAYRDDAEVLVYCADCAAREFDC